MSPIRPAIEALEPNGIGLVAMAGLGEPDIIPLWFGETDLVTPAFIRDAAKAALDDGKTFYAQSRGIPQLRDAIRAYHKRTVGADVAPERISLPGAATLAVVTALQILCDTGDNVVIVSPIWPSIFQAAQMVGAVPRFVRLDDDWRASPPRWTLDVEKIFAACDARTKAIFINSPGNPTGWIMPRSQQREVLDFARARGIAIISDEVYGTMTYDGSQHAPSMLEIATGDDDLFVINSFSKAWAMTGWRIGWLVHPARLEKQLSVITVANNTGPTVFAQYGAMAALSPQGDAFREAMRDRCAVGRDVVQKFIDAQNRIQWIRPEGAFYGFLHMEGLRDSLGFAQGLVKTARVGVAPGSAFGPAGDKQADSFLRICFAQDPALLGEGLSRIEKALAGL
ncbi:MAG TPA: aminotransferase class I/II-fold pyridoxal phosphate-dependent enzyme [Rhizomicrobium sp.]|jgi:aspartate/methionine/tyrosine aminotransferase|nr:aminotransferase class I/II-fold pyridoxal phosphate-dependent enzyme [Rhizomicrobium sp.]